LRDAGLADSNEAERQGIITPAEAARLAAADAAIARAVEVDAFAADSLGPRGPVDLLTRRVNT
jgi:hypothetical protein